MLLDGHSSRCDPDTLEYTLANALYTMFFIPNTTADAQPQDMNYNHMVESIFQLLRRIDENSIGTKLKKNSQVTTLAEAAVVAGTPENIRAGFVQTGLGPVSRARINTDPSLAFGVDDQKGTVSRGFRERLCWEG